MALACVESRLEYAETMNSCPIRSSKLKTLYTLSTHFCSGSELYSDFKFITDFSAMGWITTATGFSTITFFAAQPNSTTTINI